MWSPIEKAIAYQQQWRRLQQQGAPHHQQSQQPQTLLSHGIGWIVHALRKANTKCARDA